jgi:hypothetical protein
MPVEVTPMKSIPSFLQSCLSLVLVLGALAAAQDKPAQTTPPNRQRRLSRPTYMPTAALLSVSEPRMR